MNQQGNASAKHFTHVAIFGPRGQRALMGYFEQGGRNYANAFPAFNQWARLKNPGGKSAISACWASRSLTIFRNGPLFGVMTTVKGVSQSAIVRLNVRRQALTVRCNNCCTCRVRCYFCLIGRPGGSPIPRHHAARPRSLG
jgi:hypothetical protein